MVWFDRALFILLGTFLLLYGLAAVTNVRVEWMAPLTGFTALLAGVVCWFRAFR